MATNKILALGIFWSELLQNKSITALLKVFSPAVYEVLLNVVEPIVEMQISAAQAAQYS